MNVGFIRWFSGLVFDAVRLFAQAIAGRPRTAQPRGIRQLAV